MSIKRAFLIMLATLLLPGLALAQTDTRAAFTVYKNFTDNNPNIGVTIHMDCFNALPQQQMQTVIPDGSTTSWELEFIAKDFVQGELDCTIWEEDVPGYDTGYACDSNGGEATYLCDDGLPDPNFEIFDRGPCTFTDVDTTGLVGTADQAVCRIRNQPQYVPVIVHKDWVIDGNDGSSISQYYSLKLECDGKIQGGRPPRMLDCKDDSCSAGADDADRRGGSPYWSLRLYKGTSNGVSDKTYTANVRPDWEGGTACWVDEYVADSTVDVDNDCRNINVTIGGPDRCTITNTVFFEGIPTLSQYGMAILALLMLGVGFVSFRRFA